MNKYQREMTRLWMNAFTIVLAIGMYMGITNRLDKIADKISIKNQNVCIYNQKSTDSTEVSVTATYYNAVPGQCDSSPLITADNSRINLAKLKKREIIQGKK